MLWFKVEGCILNDLASPMLKPGDIHESCIDLLKIYYRRLLAEFRTTTDGYCSKYLTYLQKIIVAAQILHRLASSCLITMQTGGPFQYLLKKRE